MAYAVSQLRKVSSQESTNTYMEPLTRLTLAIVQSPSYFGDSNTFSDYAIQRLSANSQEEGFQAGKVYYIRFKIHKIPQFFYSGSQTSSLVTEYMLNADMLTVSLLLKNSNKSETEETPLKIGDFTVPVEADPTITDSYSYYSFVFSPSKNFDTLIFRINRVSYDKIWYADNGYRKWLTDQLDLEYSSEEVSYTRYNNNHTEITIRITGKRIVVDLLGDELGADFCELKNLLALSKNKKSWLKFGYQSRPGNLIVVNNEPIIVGRSGIYEIDNGTEITSFMIACPNGNIDKNVDAFLLDYAYISS